MSYVSELISRVVSAHELSPDDFGVKAELFADFADEWRFLSDYQKRFRKLPNVATFMLQFPEFPFINSDHNAEWLLEEVEQECAGHVFDAEMTDILDLRAVNPRDAAAKMYDLSVRIKQMTAVQQMRHSLKSGVYPADSITWRNELAKITTGIPTGFDLLDEVTFGTQPGEIEIWFGRPGEG